ncbi:MAG: DUF4399 domain-containing protein [Trueperaceae bacterium]|nr:DUF4399 domain-containing protein [Trueperaceae bacterium]
MKSKGWLFIGFLVLALVLAQATRTPSAEGASVYFINLTDGDTVKSPVLVRFGLKGMGIAPAGVQFENTGHFHLLIDLDATTLDMNTPLPSTDNLKHFGKGQTETYLELAPGEHSLQLLLADFAHIPHEPVLLSEKISITVTE